MILSNDIMKFAILKISNDDMFGTSRPINIVFDSGCLLPAAREPRRLPVFSRPY